MSRVLLSRLSVVALCFTACKKNPNAETDASTTLTREALLDPRSCQSCHPGQFAEWQGSVHAFAASDPVFLAMNRRGQEETDGALGTFCVNCHAPMAVRDGLTEDGLNLAELGFSYQGVTCFFCHSVDAVEGSHNNPLQLRSDGVFTGPFDDPSPNPAHASAYSTHADATHTASSAACGACHDVKLEPPVTATEFNLERTFEEYQSTLFADTHSPGFLSCNGCHMPISSERDHSAVSAGAPKRKSRRHDFEGVDLPPEDWPGFQRQKLLTEQFLGASLVAEVCVTTTGVLAVTLENIGAGHHFPSGASHDRLVWLELRAFTQDDSSPVFLTTDPEQLTAGASQTDSGSADTLDAGALADSLRVTASAPVLTDTVLTRDGQPAHMFWEVASKSGTTTLPGSATLDPLDPQYHRERKTWLLDTGQSLPEAIAAVDLTVHVRPIKLAVLQSLQESGHISQVNDVRQEDLQMLPNRCYDAQTLERYPDVLQGSSVNCDPEAKEFTTTLRWERSATITTNRAFRETTIDGAAARCLTQ